MVTARSRSRLVEHPALDYDIKLKDVPDSLFDQKASVQGLSKNLSSNSIITASTKLHSAANHNHNSIRITRTTPFGRYPLDTAEVSKLSLVSELDTAHKTSEAIQMINANETEIRQQEAR